MKFIVDANLPYKLALTLKNKGYDAIHTDDLPSKDRTTDKEILKVSETQDRNVITKDADFLDSYIINKTPKKLLLISTGNISNKLLAKLFDIYFDSIVKLFETYNFIDMNNEQIIGHEK